MERFGVPATARASLALYNTREEIDALGARAAQSARGVRLMSDLRELYQEVILDHNKRPRNFRALDDAEPHAEGYNPLCGDRLTLYLKVDGDVITDVSFEGSGCAISKASASLMTDAVKGKTGGRGARAVRALPPAWSRRRPTSAVEDLGKLAVARRRARVSRAREVREPGVAHAEGGARARASKRVSTE